MPKEDTQFKKGNLPHNNKPIGSEMIDKDGFVRVKVTNKGNINERWKLKHYIIYEQHHPDKEIFKTDRIIFLDGNKRNFDIYNLELVTIKEQVSLSHYGKLSNAEETKSILNLIRIRIKLLDLGADKRYCYFKKWADKNKDKMKEYARKSAKIQRKKRKEKDD